MTETLDPQPKPAIQEILNRLQRLKSMTEDAGCEFPEELLTTANRISRSASMRSSFVAEPVSSDSDLSVPSDAEEEPEARMSSVLTRIKAKNRQMSEQVQKQLSLFRQANSQVMKNQHDRQLAVSQQLRPAQLAASELSYEQDQSWGDLTRIKQRVSSSAAPSPDRLGVFEDTESQKLMSQVKEIRTEVSMIQRNLSLRSAPISPLKQDTICDTEHQRTVCASCELF